MIDLGSRTGNVFNSPRRMNQNSDCVRSKSDTCITLEILRLSFRVPRTVSSVLLFIEKNLEKLGPTVWKILAPLEGRTTKSCTWMFLRCRCGSRSLRMTEEVVILGHIGHFRGIDVIDAFNSGVHGTPTSDTEHCVYELSVFIFPHRGKAAGNPRIETMKILPPQAGEGSLGPELSFSSKILHILNTNIRLRTLAAYWATLGGGYFLCRYLSVAVRLARAQRVVALAVGDVRGADVCTLNECYNYIYAGRVDVALQTIRGVLVGAQKRGDDILVGMCESAVVIGEHMLTQAVAIEGNGRRTLCLQTDLQSDTPVVNDFQHVGVLGDQSNKLKSLISSRKFLTPPTVHFEISLDLSNI